ncbi:hypothetical protein C9J60_05370 [Streptomyces sp. A244]|uniref:TraR/DksA C4-type zinc finger protein n=1 Tax=Streptomyces sp. A244 TaxID=2137016 RepID=UPI000D1B3704|nr:hypothetical protein [Streptomyces sp. A244]PTH90372.1 hypothetical protein C9J60_05370 [Streptomyces sp. A244]
MMSLDSAARAGSAVERFSVHEARRPCASARMVLADAQAARERTGQGTYGSCRQCRHPMEPARLRIVPRARYCGRCHHFREARS